MIMRIKNAHFRQEKCKIIKFSRELVEKQIGEEYSNSMVYSPSRPPGGLIPGGGMPRPIPGGAAENEN